MSEMVIKPSFYKQSIKPLKKCKGCGLPKTHAEFYKTGSGAPRGRCKECIGRGGYKTTRETPDWVERNPNRRKTIEARYRKKCIEKSRERVRRWRQENPELWKKQQERARQRERERGYPNAAKRRALIFGAFIEVVDKRTLYALYDGRCGICGFSIEYSKMTVDHVIPLSRGGKHSYDNVQPAHSQCNREKSNKLPEEYERDQAA